MLFLCLFLYLAIGLFLGYLVATSTPVEPLGVVLVSLGWPVVLAAWVFRKLTGR